MQTITTEKPTETKRDLSDILRDISGGLYYIDAAIHAAQYNTRADIMEYLLAAREEFQQIETNLIKISRQNEHNNSD